MKFKTVIILILILLNTFLFGQNLKMEAYEFISKAKDTVQAELGTFYVLKDRTNSSQDSIKLSFIRFKSTDSV